MWRSLGISHQDWRQTPQAVQITLTSLAHQAHTLKIRCLAYQQQIAPLRQAAAQLQDIKAQIARHEEEIAALRRQVIHVEDLKAEIAELKERLGQNSRNSHLPPSTDPPSQKKKPESKPTGRKRGAQPGHPGKGRKLLPLDEVDTTIKLKPTNCSRCGHLLLGDDLAPMRHQVSEVPQVKVVVTEYQRHSLTCTLCGAVTQAQWSEEIPQGAFGPRAQAIVGYLTGRLGASHRDVVEAMKALYGLDLSTGSVSAIERQVSQALAAPVEAARQFVHQQKAQHVDETGWREGKHRKWLWVNATADVTTFNLLGGRSTKDAKSVISETAKGTITTDRYSSYNWIAAHRRQICWAHLVRDFQALVERGGESQKIGQALLKQSKRLFKLWHKVRNGRLSRAGFEAAMQPIEQRVKKLLEAGTQAEHEKTRRTCTNILKVEPSLWTFVRVEGVEPTNNAAERPLRRAVLWRRKSFGTQSIAGSRFVERILTAVQTLRQQGREVLEYLTIACAAVSHSSGEAVCLLPQPP